jgi:hypothetical protein
MPTSRLMQHHLNLCAIAVAIFDSREASLPRAVGSRNSESVVARGSTVLLNTFRVMSSRGELVRINHGPCSARELTTPGDDGTVPVICPTCRFFLDRRRAKEVCSVTAYLQKE